MTDTPERRVHNWLTEESPLFENILDAAGEYDAKVNSTANSSLATHIINATVVGVNVFVYEAVDSIDELEIYEEDLRVLAAALALHDTNKYLREAYDYDSEGNTKAALEYYFDPTDSNATGDDFGIEDFLDGDYRDDLLYLIQNTEIGEDSTESRGLDTEFRQLERYCRTGDQVASIALREGTTGVRDRLAQRLSEDEVHRIEFTAVEQPVLNDLLLGATKSILAGEQGSFDPRVIIGSDNRSIVYLGDPVNREQLQQTITRILPELISDQFDFSCKLNWNSFDYDILAEINIPLAEKEEIIADAFRDLLGRGSAGVEAFEHIPEEFDDYFAVLAKAIYIDGRSDFDDQAVQALYDRLYDDKGSQKVKLHFIASLVDDYTAHREFLDELRSEIRPQLAEDLEPASDAIDVLVDRFFTGGDSPTLTSKADTCFLCGQAASGKYQKGLSAVYRTQEYSRRVPPHAKYKSICEVCNLEYALFADICEHDGVNTNNSIEVAYFYFDDFLADIRLRGRRQGNIVQGDADEMDDREVTHSLLAPQYYLQPLYVLDENHRMRVLHRALEAAQESGMKVVMGRPFTRFETRDAVFVDEEATRPQELLGLDQATRFGPIPESFTTVDDSGSNLQRAVQLLDVIQTIGREGGLSNEYLHLDRDEFHSIAHFAVVNHDYATRDETIRTYLESYHHDALMDMRTIAERGEELFGQKFQTSSKYEKTKIFREALDAYLSGMNQQMEQDRLTEYVESQVYAAADREQYAGHVTPDQAAAFVAAIETYLTENDLDSLKKLSDWENALVNSYYYAYDQLLADQ